MTDQSVPDLTEQLVGAESRPEWMPFDTAPEYPVEIIAYRPDAGVFAAESVRDDDNDSLTWFTAGGEEDLVGDLPTHWMPLPPPPDKPAEPPRTAAVATAARVQELERENKTLRAVIEVAERRGMERAAQIAEKAADGVEGFSCWSDGRKAGLLRAAQLIRAAGKAGE